MRGSWTALPGGSAALLSSAESSRASSFIPKGPSTGRSVRSASWDHPCRLFRLCTLRVLIQILEMTCLSEHQLADPMSSSVAEQQGLLFRLHTLNLAVLFGIQSRQGR